MFTPGSIRLFPVLTECLLDDLYSLLCSFSLFKFKSYARLRWFTHPFWLAHKKWFTPLSWLARFHWFTLLEWLAHFFWFTHRGWLAPFHWFTLCLWLYFVFPFLNLAPPPLARLNWRPHLFIILAFLTNCKFQSLATL